MIKKIKAILRARRIKKIRETPEIYRYIKVTGRGALYIETADHFKLKKVREQIEKHSGLIRKLKSSS